MVRIASIHPVCVALLAAVVMGDAGGGDEAAEATRVFESLYGTDLKAVRETPAPQDDLELGKRLLAAADQAKGQPAFLAVLLERAADLAEVHPDGYETAIGALVRLSEAIPEKAGAAAGRIVGIRQKQFSAARGADRSKAGEALIDALLAAADSAENAGDLSDAETLLRRAQRVGRSVRSDRLSGIDARLSRVAHAIQTATSIAQHKDRLAKDPANHGARAELVRLLLVDADDPAEAAKYVEGLEDEAMRANVLAAAKGPEAADEPGCMELGEWYRSLGEVARGAEKAYASASGCSLGRALVLAGVSLALEVSPVLALVPLAFDGTRLVGCGGIAVLAAFLVSVVVMTRWGRAGVLPALIAPAVMVLGAVIFVRAGLLGWWRGGVLWRGTLYPSAALRAGRRVRLI